MRIYPGQDSGYVSASYHFVEMWLDAAGWGILTLEVIARSKAVGIFPNSGVLGAETRLRDVVVGIRYYYLLSLYEGFATEATSQASIGMVRKLPPRPLHSHVHHQRHILGISTPQASTPPRFALTAFHQFYRAHCFVRIEGSEACSHVAISSNCQLLFVVSRDFR
jgi:hypothetical protein